MSGQENENVGFQQSRSEGFLNCPSSRMATNTMPEKASGVTMSSLSMFKPPTGSDPFFASGWDPLVSLSQTENFGGSSMVTQGEFCNPPYNNPVVLESQGMSSTSHLVQYPSNSSFAEMVPKLSCFGSGSFSDMVGSFGLPQCIGIVSTGCPPNYPEKISETTSTVGGQSQDGCQISDGGIGSSPNEKRRKRVPDSNSPLSPDKVKLATLI